MDIYLTELDWKVSYYEGDDEEHGEPLLLIADNTGLPWHIQALRVTEVEEKKEDGTYTGAMIQEPFSESIRSEYEGLQKIYEGFYNTVQFPDTIDIPGDWVLFAVPFAD